MPNGNLNRRNLDGGGNGSKQRQGDGKPSASLVVELQAASSHGNSEVEASLKRKMSPSSQSSPRKQNARSYLAWQKNLKKNSIVTDNMPVDQIVNSGERTEGAKEDSAGRSRCSKEFTASLNGGEKLGNAEGSKMRHCNGKGCKESCGIMDDIPFGVWHCSSCVRKKMLYGVHSVSEGVESIWNARQVDLFDKYGSLQVPRQYFVKYKDLAHVHNRWEAESKLLVEAPSLVAKFSQRNQESTWQPDWMVLDRVLEQRTLISSLEHEKDPHFMSNCQHEWLVKWCGLGYEHATWELENSSFLCCPDGQVLIQDYYTRHKKESGDKSPLEELSQLPGGCSSDIELDKYIDFVKKLQQYKKQNAIIFDKARIMKIISFVKSFSSDVYRPILIISTSTTIPSWEKEFLSLAKSVNVVVYSENKKIREHIRRLEFYRENGSIMFQVLLTSPEVVIEDLEVLSCIGWEVLVVDECQCSKVASCLEQIKILHTGMRLLVASGQLKCSIPEYINVLSFLDSDGNSNSTTIGSLDTKFIISTLKKRLAGYVVYDSETKSCRFVEYWVPAVISNVQLELYCDTLLSNSLFLCSSSKSDSVGTLGNLLIALQKCCDHPYVANRSIQQKLLTGDQKEGCLGIGIKASGKLILLDAMLSEMKKKESKVLLLIQVAGDGSGRDFLGNILGDFLCQRFGPDSYGRIDAAVAPSEKKSALDKFNKEQGRFVLLLEKRACLPSIKLSSLDAIILYDSDWIPMNDVRTLQKLTFCTQMEQINLFRLYSTCTVEEKVLILSTEGKVLDGNVQNIGPSTGRELLMWDASYMFAKLDEFQRHSSLTVDALEKSHLEDVLQEFVTILSKKSDNDESISISMILQVKLDGKIYHANHPLLGERKRQVKDDDLPHVFWIKNFQGRHLQSKFSSDLTPKKRRRVHYFDDSQEKSDYKNAKVDEELVKVSSGNGHRDFLEGQHIGFSVSDKGDDKTMVHEGKKLCDSQRSMYNGLKSELAELCEVLCLPEDVKAMVGRFLEYVINNHNVSRNSENLADAYQNDMDTESKSWCQAFQLSLCWTAASLVKHKIKHSESVVLAKKDLNYSCEKEDVNVAYSMLRCLKELFRRHLKRPILPHSFQSTESHTKGLSTSISCSSSEPRNVDAETISVHKEASNWNGTLDSRSIPELQGAQRGLSGSIKWIEKKCNKKWRELLRKQKEKKDDFSRKYDEKIASMERTRKVEEAVVRLHSSHLSISSKLKKLENEYMQKFNKLGLRMDQKWKKLDAKQLAVRNKILTGRDNWIELVTSWVQTEMIKKPTLAEYLPSIPVSETISLLHHNVSPQVVSSNDSIDPANLIGSEQIRDVTRSSMPDGQVMLVGAECILDILENITPVLPPSSDGSYNSSEQIPLEVIRNGASIFEGTDTSGGCSVEVSQQNEMRETVLQLPKVQEDAQEQNVASEVLGNTAHVVPPPSEKEVSSVSLSCSPTEENQLLITESSPNGCDVEACQWSEMRETISQVDEVQKNNAHKKRSLASDVMGNMALVFPPSSEEEVPSVFLSCSPTEENQLVRTGSSAKGCGVEACQWSGMRESVSQVYVTEENNALKEQNVAQHVTVNMAPALSTSSEGDVPSLSHSCSPTHEIQLGRSNSPSISEGGDTNVRCVFEICRSNETLGTVHLVSEVQEDIPQEQNSGEILGNTTRVIPVASQNEVPCVPHPCSPTEEIQFGTGSSLVISEGNLINTGGAIEVHKHSSTRDTVSQVSKTQVVAPQEQNVLLVPNAQSALSPCNLGPQLTEQTSLVQNVPSIAEGCSSPSNQVPQNLSSPALPTSEALAEDVSNINAQTTSQEVQASLSHAAACLIDVSCRDPEILASESEEEMQDLVSHRTHLLDLPSVDENSPHGESQTTQSQQACGQLEYNQIELPNEDILRHPRNATIPSGSSSHYMSSSNATSSQTPLHLSDDPLQNEVESIRKEREKISKTCEDTRLQLISDYNKEMGQIFKKYEAKLRENESVFLIRNSELNSNYSLALRNKVLAESFRMQCKDSEAFQLVGNYHVTNSSTLQHQVRFSSQMVAPVANSQRNLQSAPPAMDHHMQFIKHRSQVLSDAPTRLPCSNSVYRNIHAEREIHGPPTTTLQDNFAQSPQMIHHHLLSMQRSSQMSPSIPARPPFVNTPGSAICGPAQHPQPFRFPALHVQHSLVHSGLGLRASVQQRTRTPSTLQSNTAQQSQSAIVVCVSDEE